jgi:hypothetical protein
MVLLTFKQSKNMSTISQDLAVAAASGGPNLFNTAAMDALRTYAARFTRITEYGVRFMSSEVIFGKSFKPLSASL